VRHAFTDLDRSHIVSLITPQNAPSIRVAVRLGERLEEEIALPHLAPDRTVLQYGLSREEWRRQHAETNDHG
jgi:RimJ/RimL family protein N-acetyltransferase